VQKKYTADHNAGKTGHEHDQHTEDESTPLHDAAKMGDSTLVTEILDEFPHFIDASDYNGWNAIHEAARTGDVDTVKALVDGGADVAARTKHGGTALWWAKRTHGEEHDVVQYLVGIGAPDEGEL
jgi:ankyrin repeat protein